MTSNDLIALSKTAATLARKHRESVRLACLAFEEMFGVEPDMDSQFMAWIHYGEQPENIMSIGNDKKI